MFICFRQSKTLGAWIVEVRAMCNSEGWPPFHIAMSFRQLKTFGPWSALRAVMHNSDSCPAFHI
jgi:hypothetical protein